MLLLCQPFLSLRKTWFLHSRVVAYIGNFPHYALQRIMLLAVDKPVESVNNSLYLQRLRQFMSTIAAVAYASNLVDK